MDHAIIAAQLLGGAAAGGAMAWLYFLLLRRQVERFAAGEGHLGRSVFGYASRLALIGGLMALLLWWHIRAALAYAVVFLVVRAWKLRKYAASTQEDNVEP